MIDEPSVIVHYEIWGKKEDHDIFEKGEIHVGFSGAIKDLVAHHNIPKHYKLIKQYQQVHEKFKK